MLNFNEAKLILEQVKSGEWKSEAWRPSYWNTGNGKVYWLYRGDVKLWVASGFSFLRLESTQLKETNVFPIPLHLQLYLWFFGVREFVANRTKEFNRDDIDKAREEIITKLHM